MIAEVEAGNVGIILTKDMSRFGRDYLQVGLYTEVMFPSKGVRFIAISNNIDSINQTDSDFTPFLNIMNEWYARDCSRKIKSVFKSRMEKGLRCSGSISYGFLADPNDKEKWIIDEEAAAVVRRIFQMVIEGKGINEIGRILRAEKIPIPSEHWKRIGVPYRSVRYTDPYAWSATTLGYILQKPEYMGRKVLGKTVCDNYKTKNNRKTAPEEQFVFDGAIPEIVDEETWHNAQRLRKTVRRPPKREGPPHRLTGLLYCADCGAKLNHRNTLVQKKYIDDAFVCSSYRQLTRDCTMHYITTANMEKLILSAIQRISWYVREHEKEFIKRVREASSIQQEETAKECKRRLSQSKRRHTELDDLVKKLYEANATGKLNDRHFERLLSGYDEEQMALESTMSELQEQIDAWSEDKLKTDRFIELVKRYTDFSELTTPMLNEFIEKVIVHEGDKRGTDRRQRVDIYLNFIGAFELPAEVVTPIDLDEQRRQMEEKAEKIIRAKELEKARTERYKQEKREHTARKKAGLLTPEEMEAEVIRMDKKRERQRAWREKTRAAAEPKPEKALSMRAIAERKKDGLPVSAEDIERYDQKIKKKREYTREWREKKKAEAALPMAANQ
jgi:hypothetical protein